VSLILDALRHRPKGEPRDGRDARTNAVPDTLGYPRPPSRRGLSAQRIIGIASGAIAFGFLAVALPVYWAARQATPRQAAVRPPVTPKPAPLMDAPPLDDTLALVVPAAPSAPAGAPVAATPSTASTARLASAPKASRSAPSRPVARPSREAATTPLDQKRSSPAPVSGPALASNHFALALYYQRVSDFDSALAQYRILLEQNDASAEVHNNLGLLYQDRGNTVDALREFRRAIALDPAYVKAHNNLGVAYLRARQFDAAAAELKLALDIDSRNIESLVNLALVQKAAGRTAEARDLLRRAVAQDPRHAGSHYNLAVVADEGGDMVTAVTHYRAFLQYGAVGYPDLAARVRSRLTALESG
jgi:Tfp pilus assembly protein PilF